MDRFSIGLRNEIVDVEINASLLKEQNKNENIQDQDIISFT